MGLSWPCVSLELYAALLQALQGVVRSQSCCHYCSSYL